jgi:hypothetical protein
VAYSSDRKESIRRGTLIRHANSCQGLAARIPLEGGLEMPYDDEDVVKVLIKGNPKREGTACWHVWNYYWDGMTVGEFRHKVKGGHYRPDSANGDLKWDIEHGFIKIEITRSPGTRAAPSTGAVDSAQMTQNKMADNDEGKTVAVATRQLNEIAIGAIRCNACFETGQLTRSYVDLPQPRYIGPGYINAHPKIAWVMINPGAGSANPGNQSWHSVLMAYCDGEASLDDVFAEQRRHFRAWNKLLPFLDQHGLDVDSIALVNIAWCASKNNEYPKEMLLHCWDRHTSSWLAALAPDIVILSGSAVHRFETQINSLLPAARVIKTFHYAHRPRDAARADARAAEIRKELGL